MLLGATPAYADEWQGPEGLEFGARAGWAVPLGKFVDSQNQSADLSETVAGLVAGEVGFGYRIPRLYVGLAGGAGIGVLPKDACTDAKLSCSAADLKFKIEGQFHILPAAKLDPWLGLGIGYEAFLFSETFGSAKNSGAFGGFQFLSLSAGADYRVSDLIAVGPVIDFGMGSYSVASVNSRHIGDFETALHEWFFIGGRIVFDVPINKPASQPKPAPRANPDLETPPETEPPPPENTPPPTEPQQPPPVQPPTQPTPPPADVQPATPGNWPPSVPIADRSQCSLVCVSVNGAAVTTKGQAAVEKALSNHLGALRACASRSGKAATTTALVDFDAMGHARIDYAISTRESCTLPPSPALSGPQSTTWKCTDYCE